MARPTRRGGLPPSRRVRSIAVTVVLLAGCSNGATSDGSSPSVSSTTSTSAVSSTSPTSPTSPATLSTHDTIDAVAPSVSDGSGWRLTVSHPVGGATIGLRPRLCTEVTGTSREALISFELTVVEPASGDVVGAVRAVGAVGRASADVDLTGTPPGVYDLRVDLMVDGTRVDGARVSIPSVTLAAAADATVCP